MKNRLQDYFDAARNVENSVSLEEVQKLTGSGLRSRFHFNLKYKIIMGTGFITLLSVLFYMQRPAGQPFIQPKNEPATSVIQHTLAEASPETETSGKTTYHSSSIKPERKTIAASEKADVVNSDRSSGSFQIISTEPEFSPSGSNANDYFDEAGRLVLSYEELAALGIITNGNVLEYANVTDTAKTYTWEGTSIISWPFYRLSVEEHGSRRVDIASTTDTGIIGNSKPFWAAAVTYGDDKSSLNIPDNIYGVGYDRLYFNGVRPLLIPVSVELKAKPGRWSHDLSLVFWFKPTASFYHALPGDVVSACIKRFGTKSDTQFRDSLDHYRAQVAAHGRTKGFDAATVALLKKNYLRLPKAQLKKWDIYPRENGFYYSGLIEKENRVYWLRIKEKKHYTGITTSRFLRFKKLSEHIPVALTDTLITMVHYLHVSYNGQEQNQDSLLASFKEHAHQLVPVFADPGTLIWFRPNPADTMKTTVSASNDEKSYLPEKPLMQKADPSQGMSFSITDVLEQQKRYVPAKPDQYKSLGIYIDEKELTYQNWFIQDGKVLDQFVARKNDGSVFLGIRNAKGTLRPYDNPFQLVAITGVNMESSFFFGNDSFGIQSNERAELFRNRIDKLVPVVVKQNGQEIVCWFTDHADLRYLLEEPSSTDHKLKRPASFELTTEKAIEIGLIRMADGKIVIPVEGDEQISFVATSLSVDNTSQSPEWIGFRSGPLVTFSKRYKATPYKTDSMAALFGQVRFTPLFVTETDGHFGFVKFEKRSGQARIKELTDADNGKGTLGDAAGFSYSNRLDEFITIRLVTDKAPLILWYDRNEALEKLLNTQPSSDVKRTELYYCEEGKVNIDVHPNPTDRELGITIMLSNDEVISADLYDLTGKHCMTIPAGSDRETNGSVHFKAIIDHLREGIYIVTIRTAKGKCYSRKVIKYGL